MTLTTFVIASLATYRLAALIASDGITRPLREQVVARSDWWGYLIRCVWCLSIWFGPFVVAASVIWPTNRAVLVAFGALAASAVAGIIGTVMHVIDPPPGP